MGTCKSGQFFLLRGTQYPKCLLMGLKPESPRKRSRRRELHVFSQWNMMEMTSSRGPIRLGLTGAANINLSRPAVSIAFSESPIVLAPLSGAEVTIKFNTWWPTFKFWPAPLIFMKLKFRELADPGMGSRFPHGTSQKPGRSVTCLITAFINLTSRVNVCWNCSPQDRLINLNERHNETLSELNFPLSSRGMFSFLSLIISFGRVNGRRETYPANLRAGFAARTANLSILILICLETRSLWKPNQFRRRIHVCGLNNCPGVAHTHIYTHMIYLLDTVFDVTDWYKRAPIFYDIRRSSYPLGKIPAAIIMHRAS